MSPLRPVPCLALLYALFVFRVAGAAAASPARIFFVANDVAFAAPVQGRLWGSLEPGTSVRIWRPDGGSLQVIATGRLFRVRAEHVALTIPPGSAVRPGDLVTAEHGDPTTAPADPFAGTRTGDPDPTAGTGAPAEGVRLLVLPLARAPRVVSATFDTSFREALMRGVEPGTASGVEATPRTANRPGAVIGGSPRRRAAPPTPSEIRAQAARASADLVLVPTYVSGSGGDSIEVSVFDARTGQPSGKTVMPIRPIPSLVWTPSGRRVGRLELVGRWSGVRPKPEGVAVLDDGSVVVRVEGDAFVLREGEAAVIGSHPATASQRRVSLESREHDGRRTTLLASVESVSFEEATEQETLGGDRVVLLAGDEIIFRSGSYGTITGLASRGPYLLVLAEDVVELLRLH